MIAAVSDELHERRVVLDSNIIFAGLRRRPGDSELRLPAILLNAAIDERLPIALTNPLFKEYEDVVNRPGANSLTPTQRAALLDGLCRVATPHTVDFRCPGLPDPKDEKVLEAAVAARAGFIVTYNLRDFPDVAAYGLRALDPHTFLRTIRPDLLP